jgi:hypothetical protein
MTYNPATDFLAMLRLSSDGTELLRGPLLDIVLSALSRAGLFTLSVGQTAPTTNQATTAWLQPAQPSWTAEGTLWLWDVNAAAYAAATPALFFQLLQASG